MGTKCYIGYCDGAKVEYMKVLYDSHLYDVGVKLYLLFTNPKQVKKLMDFKEINELCYNVDAPITIEDEQELELFYGIMKHHILTSFNKTVKGAKKPRKLKFETFLEKWDDVRFKYIYNAKTNIWYVCGKSPLYKLWDLGRLLTDVNYLAKFNKEEKYECSWQVIENEMTYIKRQISGAMSITEVINSILKRKDTNSAMTYWVKGNEKDYSLFRDEREIARGNIFEVMQYYVSC